jgi:hypothetical protein
LGSFLTSCKSHTPCAGVTSKVDKVKVSESPLPL